MSEIASLGIWGACMPLPLICRWRLLGEKRRRGHPVAVGTSRWRLWLAGALQDATVASLWLGLVIMLATVCPNRLAFVILSAIALSALQTYLLLDHLVHSRLGFRMSGSLLGFARESECLWSSARRVGVGDLFRGAVVVGLVAIGFTVWLGARGSLPKSSAGVFALMIASMVGGLLSPRLVPPSALTLVSNAIVLDGFQWWRRRRGASGGGSPSPSGGRSGEEPWAIPPASELAAPPVADYPLFRKTEGFAGPTQFGFRLGRTDRPHVILLILESFRAADIGVLGGRQGVSPVFDRLAAEGVLFENFYANGVQTARATEAVLFGMIPRFTAAPVQTDATPPRMVGLADLLGAAGYRCASFQGGPGSFQNQDTFFTTHGFGFVAGAEQILEAVPGAHRLTSWGVADEHLLQFVLNWLKREHDGGQPTFSVILTTTNHHPWEAPPGYPFRAGAGIASRQYRDFLRTFHYTDHCLGLFVEALRREEIWRQCVLFVLADTGQPMGERDGNFMLLSQLHEEGQRIPLLLLAPGRLAKPARLTTPASQIDLLPTVMDLLGLAGSHHAMGESLRRKTARFPVVMNNPLGEGWWGLRAGPWKLLQNVYLNQTALFNLDQDPGETRDLGKQALDQHAALLRRLAAIRARLDYLYGRDRLAPANGTRGGSHRCGR